MAKSKEQIAQDMYDEDFVYLTAGEKAQVTKKFNRQATGRRRASDVGVKATIGRVGNNGVNTCILPSGATVQDLLTQSKQGFDVKKEEILDQDTGLKVDLSDVVKHNGTYAIAPAIDSNSNL